MQSAENAQKLPATKSTLVRCRFKVAVEHGYEMPSTMTSNVGSLVDTDNSKSILRHLKILGKRHWSA